MVILLLSILGIQLWIRARKRKKTNLLLSHLNDELKRANLVKSKFFSIISHDLRAPISNIISLMQLSKETSVENPSLQNHFDKITRDAENLLESMDTMLMWSKGQLDQFKPEKKTVQTSTLLITSNAFSLQKKNLTFSSLSRTHQPCSPMKTSCRSSCRT
jgi:signal transduction histidine kinase